MIVRLSLFWTLLIMVERPTLYYAFATPGEVFVRLAEIFIMGKCYGYYKDHKQWFAILAGFSLYFLYLVFLQHI